MFFYLVLFFVIYKILDYLIRIPKLSNLAQRNVMVTGCDSGFGRSIALQLANKGVTVFASCMTEQSKKDLEKSSPNIKPFIMDISDLNSVQLGYRFVASQLGQNKGLWAILNNAGTMQHILGPLEWQTSEDFKKVLSINVVGHHNVTQKFLPLVKMTRGRIAFTSSLAGILPEPSMNLYVASKFAVEGYVSCIRADLKLYGVSCHLVEPGVYNTPLVETMFVRLEDFLKEMPKHLVNEFPEEYQREYIRYIRDYMDGLVSSNVQEVVDIYEHVMFARYPRGRYPTMFGVKILQMLPEYIVDFILNIRCNKPQPPLVY